MTEAKPVLWHIPVSHYNEKVRWALALKGVEHERKAPPPGVHMLVSLWLTRGAAKTFPVMEVNGSTFGDSSEIIAELERLYPEPRLLPAEPRERARALELEEFFDDGLGPAIRLLAWHEITAERSSEGMRSATESGLPAPLRRFGPVVSAATRVGDVYVRLRYGVRDEQSAALARNSVLGALDRLEAELGDREYLVADSFTVADLTAASLFYPLVRPPEGPQVIESMPQRLAEWWAPHADRRGADWVRTMFAKHR